MKRLLALSTVTGLLVSIPASHLLWSSPPDGRRAKVNLCHVSGNRGKVKAISVSESAVPAHLAHGDCVLEEGQECSYDEVNGIAVCAVPPPEE